MSAPLPELGPEGMLAMILDLMVRNARPEVRVDAEVPVGRFRVWLGTFGELALVVPTEQDAAGLDAQLDTLFPREARTIALVVEAPGPAISPDCFTRKHHACSGDGGIDAEGAYIPCACECHA